jgi:hypothetical protein
MIGDCFESAFLYLHDLDPETRTRTVLVHARVMGEGPLEGREVLHAWCEEVQAIPLPPEVPEEVRALARIVVAIDLSAGRNIRMLAGLYRRGRVLEERRYTWEEARTHAVRTGHYGAWEVEGEGLPAEPEDDDEESWEE